MIIDNPVVSGSLNVQNNVTASNGLITNNLTVEGTIYGAISGSSATASYVEYENVANKPTLVSSSAQLADDISGSFTSLSSSLSTRLTDDEGSISSLNAASSSYLLNTTDTLTGDLTVTGTLTAQDLVVQEVTSSIIFSSGSNRFGNELTNSHNFTGSVNITGSLNVNGAEVGTGKLDETVFNAYTSSTDTRLDNLEATGSDQESRIDTLEGKTLISSSVQIGTEISGAFTDASSSFSSRVTDLESFSSSLDATFATDQEVQDAVSSLNAATSSYALTSSISGAFDSVSSSIASDIEDIIDGTTTVASASHAVSSLTASYALNAGAGAGFPFSGSAIITGSLEVSGSTISGSFIGDGSGLTGITVSSTNTVTSSFSSTGSVTILHSFNSKNVSVSVYDNNDILIIPQQVTLLDNNNVKIDFGGNTTGFAVLAKGGHLVSGSVPVPQLSTVTDSFTSTTSHTVTHNFGTKEVIVSVYENDELIIPDSISTPTTDTVTVSFPEAISGRVVVVKAGHIVSGSIPFSNLLDSPLISGSGAITASGHLIPSENETYDLGSSTKRWRDIYLSSASIYLGNTVITEGNIVTTGSLSGSLPAGVISGSAQIATEISGAFTSVSSSFASGRLKNTTDTLTGDLTVTGTITAQEFHTQFVSASIIYQSGSTQFGNSSDDTHVFTGGVGFGITPYATAQLSVDSGTKDFIVYGASSDATASISLRDNSSTSNIIYGAIGNNHIFLKDGTEHMRIDANGNVGIGTTATSAKFEIRPTTNVNLLIDDSSNELNITSGTDQGAYGVVVNHRANYHKFFTDGGSGTFTEKMRIDANGNVGIKTTSNFTGAELDVWGDIVLAQQNWALRGNDGNANFAIEELAGGAFNDSNIRLEIATGGNVGINVGTSAPTAILDVRPNANTSYASNSVDAVRVGRTAAGRPSISFDTSDTTFTNRVWFIENYGPAASLTFGRNGLDVMSLRETGDILMTKGWVPDNLSRLVIRGDGTYSTTFSRAGSTLQIISDELSNDTWSPVVNITNVRQSLTTGNASFGGIGFSSIDDSNNAGMTDAARIALVNESPSAVVTPTSLAFYTNAGTATTGSASEKMRIDSSGNVGIGVTSPTSTLHIENSDSEAVLTIEKNTVTAGTTIGTLRFVNSGATNTYASVAGGRNSDGDGMLTLKGGGSSGLHILESGQMRTLNRDFAKESYYGYSSSYKALILGSTGTNTSTNSTTVSINYDPIGNAYSGFSGDGREVLFRRGVQFVTPNSADNSMFLYNLVLKDGHVGIANNNPLFELCIGAADAPNRNMLEIAVSNSDTGTNIIQNYNRATAAYTPLNIAGSYMTFGVGSNATERMRITGDGTVAIGNPSSVATAAKLQLGEPLNAGSSAIFQANGFARIEHGLLIHWDSDNTQAGYLQYGGTNGFSFTTEGAGSGNVGIGTTSPSKKLDVNGAIRTRNSFNISDGTTQIGGLFPYKVITGAGSDNSTALFAETGLDLHFMTNGSVSTKVIIKTDGNVGIGTTSPAAKLDVNSNISTSSATAIQISQNTNGAIKGAAGFGVSIQNGGESTNAAELYIMTAEGGSLASRMRISSQGLVATQNSVTAHSLTRHYTWHNGSVSNGTTVDLIENASAYTDVTFIAFLEVFHSSRTYRTIMGSFGGYGYNVVSGGGGLSLGQSVTGTGTAKLQFSNTSGYSASVHIHLIIVGDTSITVHNGYLAPAP